MVGGWRSCPHEDIVSLFVGARHTNEKDPGAHPRALINRGGLAGPALPVSPRAGVRLLFLPVKGQGQGLHLLEEGWIGQHLLGGDPLGLEGKVEAFKLLPPVLIPVAKVVVCY